MGLKDLIEKQELSRRGLLKGITAVAAAGALVGCNKDDYSDVLIPDYTLTFDHEAKTYWSTGAYNCGARCLHKVYAKNNRILKLTSAGDIPRKDCKASDEEIGTNGSIQRRACVRGYAYIQRLYQPDKLKYPLLQTKTKGDLSGFKRISWQEAFEYAAKAYYNAYKRKETLGYSPILDRWDMVSSEFTPKDPDGKPTGRSILHPIMMTVGNESTGAADAAKYDCVGPDGLASNMADRLNSDFIITWGLDPSRSTYHVAHAHWYNTVAKERGIEMVVIASNYSDSAAMISSGFTHTYSVNNVSKTVKVPGWIPCRPATDGILAVAMAYVIYKNALHDATFINDYCFGFSPNDTVTSTAPSKPDGTPTPSALTYSHTKNLKSPAPFTDAKGVSFEKGKPYTGAEFNVPAGESFVEYLLSREVEWGLATEDSGTSGYKYPQPFSPAIAGDSQYDAVLAYAAKMTGIKPDTIEALAFKYAKPKGNAGGVSFIDAGGGPQRAMNGVEWNWLAILLTAMTGHIAKSGGGPAYSMMAQTDIQAIGLFDANGLPFMAPSAMLADAFDLGKIHVIMNNWSHLILTGKDYRSRERFIEDVRVTCGDELANKLMLIPNNEKLIEIDLFVIKSGNYLTTAENINKNVLAVKSVPTVIVIDQTMTPSAKYADLILPACSHYEKETTQTQVASAAIIYNEKVIDTLFDTKLDGDISAGILKEFDQLAGTSVYVPAVTPSAASIVAFGPSSLYKANVGGENRRMSMENLKAKGFDEFVIPPDKPLVPFGTDPVKNAGNCILGKLETTTGRINFYSPLWGVIRQKSAQGDGFRTATAAYVENVEGYEKFFDNTGKFTGFKARSGRVYPLLYMTNKARNRAHTVLDNVAMIRDQFRQTVKMNPKDAGERGIRDGDIVYVYNDRGCTKLPAELLSEILPGVISIEHGAWYCPHPTETVKVWINKTVGDDTIYEEVIMPVDVGGAENMITYELAGTEVYVGQAVSAQGGPCEVSRIKPE